MSLSIFDIFFNWRYYLLVLGLTAIYFIFIKPLLLLRFYKAQGARIFFFPIIGELPFHTLHSRNYFQKYEQMAKENPNFQFSATNVGSGVLVELADVNLIKSCMNQYEKYAKSPQLSGMFVDLLPQGLVSVNGAQWKKQRTLFSSVFHFEFLKGYIPQMQQKTKELLGNLKKKGKLDGVSVMLEIQQITGEIVGNLFFGEELSKISIHGNPLTEEVENILREAMGIGLDPVNIVFGPKVLRSGLYPKANKLRKRIEDFKTECQKIITDQKKKYQANKDAGGAIARTNLLWLLFEAQGNNQENFSDDEIMDTFINFFGAGTDTVAHVVNLALYYFCIYPETLEGVQKDVAQFYDKEELISNENLNKMEYTDMFIKEVMRMGGPVRRLIWRRAVEDHMIGDIKIKKDTMVNCEFSYTWFNPKYFENAEQFDVMRWTKEKEQKLPICAFTPFAAGPRKCIGQYMANDETKIIVAEFIKAFDFKLIDNYDLKMTFRFLYEPVEDLKLNLKIK